MTHRHIENITFGTCLVSSHVFQRGGASQLPGGAWGGKGVNSRVWEGFLFFVSQVHFVNQI